MTKKFLSVLALFAFVFASFGLSSVANAQVATPVPFPTFPAGCTSAFGYSITNGIPCNGTSVATTAPIAGCTTVLGYSTVNGAPCDGISVAIPYLPGCTSTFGYSNISAQPCNGTQIADIPGTVTPPVVVIPGFPTTGAGGNASNTMIVLLSSGLASILGIAYLVRRSKIA